MFVKVDSYKTLLQIMKLFKLQRKTFKNCKNIKIILRKIIN